MAYVIAQRQLLYYEDREEEDYLSVHEILCAIKDDKRGISCSHSAWHGMTASGIFVILNSFPLSRA